MEFAVDNRKVRCEEQWLQNEEQSDYVTLKPEAVLGEGGLFASVQYHINCESTAKSPENKIWRRTDFSTEQPLYVYTPKEKIALVRYVLEEKKINYILNDYSLTAAEAKGKTLCHYYTRALSVAHREFLVKKLKYGAKVESLVEEIENRFHYTEVRLLNSDFYIHSKKFSVLRRKHHTIPKRIVDILFVFLLAPVAIPICLITALLIKLESRGPVLFRQERTGLFNQLYTVIKFRSMAADAEKHGAQWASKNDMRITRVGKIIRKTRIDELPQLINVLKGEMSMVGPRPEREVFIDLLEKEIPYYRFRHAVRPGVTGYAQVYYPYGASVEDAVWKHKYDMYYIKHQTLWLDLKVLAKTVTTVLFGKGT
ncbi:sugar transferase [Kistimonas scapharcae]